jgi:hypothetical protein
MPVIFGGRFRRRETQRDSEEPVNKLNDVREDRQKSELLEFVSFECDTMAESEGTPRKTHLFVTVLTMKMNTRMFQVLNYLVLDEDI